MAITTEVLDAVEYFNNRVQGVIQFKDFVRGIKIYPSKADSYGRGYCRIHFDVALKPEYIKLPAVQQDLINYYFATRPSVSGSEFVSFLIVQHHVKDRTARYGYDYRLKGLKEFADTYHTLTTFVVKFIESFLGKDFMFRVVSLRNFSEFDQVERYWNDFSFNETSYRDQYNSEFSSDAFQNDKLQKLAWKSRKRYRDRPQLFRISDLHLCDTLGIRTFEFRRLLLEYDIPIWIPDKTTITKIYFDSQALQNLIKRKPEGDDFGWQFYYVRRHIIIDSIAHALTAQEKRIARTTKPLFKVTPKIGDILLLKNNELIQLVDVSVSLSALLTYESVLTGRVILNDLKPGKRALAVDHQTISKFLCHEDYQTLQIKYNWENKQRVKNWMKKNGLNPNKKMGR